MLQDFKMMFSFTLIGGAAANALITFQTRQLIHNLPNLSLNLEIRLHELDLPMNNL